MRCQTCVNTMHPGYVVWRGRNVAGSPPYGSLLPCPDCAGSLVVSACEGQAPLTLDVVRSYRCYSLDERGMIFFAEIIEAGSDDDAQSQAQMLLHRDRRCRAVEVWDRRRPVHVARRAADLHV